MPKLKPTMGRVIKYLHPGSADGRYPQTESPAIIMKVHSDICIDAFVMSTTGGIFFPQRIELGKQWDWLDYTKKTSEVELFKKTELPPPNQGEIVQKP